MTDIALIQNGAEVARHDRADVADWFRGIAAQNLGGADVAVFTDDAVGHLLDGLKPEDCRCLVFASNSLLSDAVMQSVNRHSGDLSKYVEGGGGIVLLHQLVDALPSFFREGWGLVLRDRAFPKKMSFRAEPYEENDVLLKYPLAVDRESLADGGHRAGPRPLYWKALTRSALSEGSFKPVLLGADDEVLVARTTSLAEVKLVVLTIPADWQKRTDLMVNATAHALHGKPLRAFCRPGGRADDEILEQWLCEDGRTAVVDIPAAAASNEGDDLDWLLTELELCVVPTSNLSDPVPGRDRFRKFVEEGGAIVEVAPQAESGTRKIQAIVGGHLEAHLVREFFVELEAASDWESPRYAFELRNVVSLLHLLWPSYSDRSELALNPRELTDLRARVQERLAAPEHREDFGSAVALAQTLKFLSGSEPCLKDLTWMKKALDGEARDVGFQAKAVLAAAAPPQPDSLWLAELVGAWEEDTGEFTSLASVARLLDALCFLGRFDRLEDPESLRSLARLICERLDEEELQVGSGWLSVEGTADIIRGLIAILDAGVDDDRVRRRLVTHVAVGSSFLRRSLLRNERNPRGLGWLACLTEALVLVDRSYPLGVGRLLALDWPKEVAGGTAVVGGREKAQIDTLAKENKRKRQIEQQFVRDRLAAAVGRWTATLAGVGTMLAIAIGGVIALAEWKIPAVLGTLAVSIALLFFLVPLTTTLERWNLLAEPAIPPFRWLRRLLEARLGLGR